MKKRITALLTAIILCVTLLTPAAAADNYAERAAEISYYISEYSLAYRDSENVPLIDALEEVLKDDPELFEKLVNAMFDRLDEYSEYMSKEVYDGLYSDGATYVGIGITVDASYPYGVVIAAVAPNSPAEEKGLKTGDIITSVNGKDVRLLMYHEVVEHLRGERGTTVKVGILRQGAGNTVVELERRVIASPSATYGYRNGDIGIIRLGQFENEDFWDFADAYNTFANDKSIKALIIDVRGNLGGDIEALFRIMNRMVVKQNVTLYKLVNKDEVVEYKTMGHAGHTANTVDNVIVLVDERSASATEVFAGSLQKLGLAEVVGTRTYGKARSQYHIELSDGAVAVISAFEIMLPDGSSYGKTGITPDFEVLNESGSYTEEMLSKLNTSAPLYKGRTSDAVLAMQKRLHALGLHPVEPNGYFGDITLWSLNVFQKAMGLRVTSHADAATLRALEKEVKDAKIYTDRQMEFALNRLNGAD